MQKTVVISLGGSLIAPDGIDVAFLKKFVALVKRYARKGHKFAIICGGGAIARRYMHAASKIINADNETLDLIGIEATKMNAFFLKQLLGKHCHDMLIHDPTKDISFGSKRILVASGWKPGWSTDYDAVLIAKQLRVGTVVNMSNVDYVYSADPRKNAKAKPLPALSWKAYRKMAGNTWKAGMNLPFDPIAAKAAEKAGISVHIVGKGLANLENLLQGKQSKGTVIR